jgi:hypothetical protein
MAGLAGCFCPVRIQPFCPEDPRYSDAKTPLTIDVHAHVFNASDLQVREFIQRVVLKQNGPFGDAARVLSGLLQSVSWELAPSAEKETEILRKLAPVLAKCDTPGSGAALNTLRDSAYQTARTELNAALQRTGRTAPAPAEQDYRSLSRTERRLAHATAQADFLIRNLPESREEYLVQRDERALIRRSEPTVQGTIDFVIQNFQYRYVSVYDYLETYSRGNTRKVDLLVAHMVDYDWWLAQGQRTRTPLRDQIAVMEQIALRTGGRVHAFAPFDPFREVMAGSGLAESSLAVVQDAVRSRGCIGVKLYPPMGFAAWGNEQLGDYWKDGSWLPEAARQPGFGKKLDMAMEALFTWATAEDVPIMAHTNMSNGPEKSFEKLASARYWQQALEKFDRGGRNIRVNFGHFGDTDLVDDGPGQSEPFVDLMTTASGAPGARAFADASYFSDVLNNFDGLSKTLRGLYLRRDGVLGKRLMYGSDWEMCLVEPNVRAYLSDFERLYEVLGKDFEPQGPQWRTLADDFFGRNAVEYLGLKRDQQTRRRLDAFYKDRVAAPGWMKKVDALTS